ncbi:MAG TPA: hypothetical protein VMG74_00435 [Gaiellaceae bacterium]|nr:hypothetical protein [Gaiellaceae bacterium]
MLPNQFAAAVAEHPLDGGIDVDEPTVTVEGEDHVHRPLVHLNPIERLVVQSRTKAGC